MGFFNLFDFAAQDARPLLTTMASWIMTSPKSAEHDVSFDLTTPLSPRKGPIRPRLSPKPVFLPLEVVLSIIETAYYDDPIPDESLLKQCALVCRAWSGPAQKLLFSRVTLRTQSACDAFCGAVNRSTAWGCKLGDAVTRLKVVMDHKQPYGLSPLSFAHAVTLCPNLYELNLALYGSTTSGPGGIGEADVSRMRRAAPSFDGETLELLRAGPMITALQFSNWSENQHSITQLLEVWPTLKSLVISGTPPQPPSPFIEPFGCSLEEVRMNFQSPPSFEFVDWLLHNSADTLRVLELEREPSLHLLEYLINTHGHALHSLSIPSCVSPEHALAVQKCKQLKELRIENPATSPRLYKRIPEGMEHIAVGLNRNTALQPVIDAIKAGSSLKTVTVNVFDDGEKHPLFSVLKMACAYEGVELTIMKNLQMFRSSMVTTESF